MEQALVDFLHIRIYLWLCRCNDHSKLHIRQQTHETRNVADKLCCSQRCFQEIHADLKTCTLFPTAILAWKFEVFEGSCSFRQYITGNPDGYGIKFFALVDARMFYSSDMEMYVGTEPDGPYKLGGSRAMLEEERVRGIKCEEAVGFWQLVLSYVLVVIMFLRSQTAECAFLL